jgi:hypothetical protein
MHGLRPIGDGLDDVQLIRQPPAGRNPGKVLRFVNKHDGRAAMAESQFNSIAEIGAARSSIRARGRRADRE